MGLLAGTIFDRQPHCDVCEKLESECICPPPEPEKKTFAPPEKQTARLGIEKRKKGKVVTVIRGLNGDQTNLPELLTRLKNHCGAGGAKSDEDELEIQGNQLERVRTELQKIGYRVKG